MATVFGIFDDAASLTRARDKLETAGLGDDVVRVIDEARTAQAGGDVAAAPIGMNTSMSGGAVVGQAGAAHPTRLSNATSELRDVPEDEKRYVEETLQHGGHMLVLHTDNVADAVGILKECGAQRIHDPR